jgi:hypothetical protein
LNAPAEVRQKMLAPVLTDAGEIVNHLGQEACKP